MEDNIELVIKMPEKMKIHIVTKSGNELQLECIDFSIDKNIVTGLVEGIKIKDITDNKLLYIDVSNIDFIYREIDKEQNE